LTTTSYDLRRFTDIWSSTFGNLFTPLQEYGVTQDSGVNLVWNLGGRGSGFGNWGSWVLNVQQMEAHSTWLRVSSPEFLFNYTQIFYLGKVTTLESVLISYSCTSLGYNNISRPPHSKIWGRDPPTPRIDAYDSRLQNILHALLEGHIWPPLWELLIW